jgi:hypothetical protein
LIQRLYDDLVEVESLAITADEAVTMLPSSPSGKYKRTQARLYTLVGKTAGRASAALNEVRSWSLCKLPTWRPGSPSARRRARRADPLLTGRRATPRLDNMPGAAQEELLRRFGPVEDPEIEARRQRILDFLLETSPQKKQQLRQEAQQEGRLTEARASLRLVLANRQLTRARTTTRASTRAPTSRP